MIVADTNLIGALFLSQDSSADAERVLLRDPAWAAPLLWRSELRNVLATYIRTARLTLAQATGIMEAALELLAGREYQVMSPDVLRLAAESGCSAYDGEFVALAEALGVPLVTHDRQLLRAFPAIATTAADFCAEA